MKKFTEKVRETVKKVVIDFALTFFSVFDWRNDGFSCAEKDENKTLYRWLLFAAIVLGAFLRIFIFWREPQLGRDAIYYLNMAEMWSKNSFAYLLEYKIVFYIPPVMLGFIQFFIRLGCSPLAAGVILNLLAGTLMIPIFYLIGKYLFDSRKAGATAAFLASFNPVLVDYSANIMRENFMLLFMALALLFIILGFRKKDIWFTLGGFFSAWAFMSRYEALEILPLMLLTLAFFAICRIFPWKKLFIDGIWFLAGIIIGVVFIMLLFGVPIEFLTEPFYAKIDRTLL